jgi:hypothetical protein
VGSVATVGTRLRVTAGVTVRAGQQEVWDLVVDWARQGEWILATRTEGGHGAGATVVGWTGIGPVGFSDPMEITEWFPPARCTVTHLGKVVRGSGVFEVLPRADASGTEFRWTEHIELPVPLPRALGKLIAVAVVGPAARIGLGWSLRRFARLAGGPAGPPAATERPVRATARSGDRLVGPRPGADRRGTAGG